MKLAVVSDVHANLEAFRAILDLVRAEGADRVVCLGDLVGYGPEPNECVELASRSVDWCLLGNHDAMAVGQSMPLYINSHARSAMEWTRSVLSDESRAYLRAMPFYRREEGCFFVHSSPRAPADWSYVTSLEEAMEAFDYFSERVCFLAHTHRPMFALREPAGVFRRAEGDSLVLAEGQRLIVNAGSVGQPRDNDPRAAAVLFDAEKPSFRVVRAEYDVAAVQEKMRRHGLSDFLAARLSRGV